MDKAQNYLRHLRVNLKERKQALLAYLESKVGASDFHAVQDAASDIREIDASLAILGEVERDFVTEPA